MLTRLLQWLRGLNPWLPYLNILLAGAAYMANEYFVQGFCQPVTWAAWVLGLSTAAFLAWPWLTRAPLAVGYGALFLQGVGFTACVYCQLFIDREAFFALVFFLVFPLLLLLPTFFGLQLLRRGLFSSLRGGRLAFGAGVLALLPVQLWAEWQYRAVADAVAQLPPAQRENVAELARVVPRSYMAERLAGAYFKYHNSANFAEDGWRPPLHDPLVNVCLWLPRNTSLWANPLAMTVSTHDLEAQVALYQRLFPERPIKVGCVCTRIGDAEGYFYWHPEWNPPGTPEP